MTRFCAIVPAVAIPLALAAADPPAKPARPPSVRAVAFSPDGKTLVAAAGLKDQPGAVVAWDAATRKPLWRRQGTAGFPSLSVAPDGKSVAFTNWTPAATRVDLATGRELGEVGPFPGGVRAVAFIPGTDLLAAAGSGDIRLWDVTAGAVKGALKGHPAGVQTLVASPTGKWLVSSGTDTARVWDVAAGAELKGIVPQDRGIGHYGIVFVGPDRVMSADNSGRQAVRELPSGKVLLRFKSTGGYDQSAYSPAGGLAAFAGHGTEAAVAGLTFRPPTAGERAAIDKLVKDFDDDSYAVREAATAGMRAVGSVAEPALARAAADGPSAEVRMRAREVRSAILNEPVRRLAGHAGEVGPMAFSPDGSVLATGAADGTVRLWDPRTGAELARLEVADPGGPPRP